MDKIARIRAKIEKRINELDKDKHINIDAKACRVSELSFFKRFLDTLSEEPDKSLEEEMEEFFETMPVLEHENIFDVTFQKIASHFAEWQKIQMLKDAVEAKVVGFDILNRTILLTNIPTDLNMDDKVRIIILKEEE